MTEDELDYAGREFIKFEDRSYRWVDIKHFLMPPTAGEQDALALLLTDVHYQDHYTSADSHEKPTINLHGPYWLDRITPQAFESVDELTALQTIKDFATDHGELGAEVISKLERDVYTPIRAAPVRYRLKDLGKDAFHEFGWVLHDFHELILFDPPTRRLDLVVAAID